MLSDRQKWQWIVMLSVSGETDDGILPPATLLSCELRCTPLEAISTIDDFVLAGLLDVVRRTPDGVQVRPHNWANRQFKTDHSGAERMRRSRASKQCGDADVTSQERNGDVSALTMSSVSEEDRYCSSQDEGFDTVEVVDAREVVR